MIKKILYGIATIAGLASCDGDYTDWLSPQSNAASEAAAKLELVVQPVTQSVDFATYTDTEIPFFTTNLEEGQATEYSVLISAEDKETTATITATADGVIQTADLNSAVTSIYGLAPTERTLTATISAEVTLNIDGETIVTQKTAAPYTFTATPDAPVIAENYYIVGGTLNWAGSCVSKAQKFSHSEQDVYADPIFTILLDVNESNDTWFAIGDDEALDAVANESDWTKLYGTSAGNGNNGSTGTLARRTELSDDGSFKVAAGPTKIKVTINMLEGTYTIEDASVPEYYMVGRQNNWSMTKISAIYPTSATTATYTSYFSGAYDCRIATPENAAAVIWDDDFGATSHNCTDATGSLIANTGNCIASPAAGYYTLKADFASMTYEWEALSYEPTSYTSIGLVGAGDDWDNDIFLTKVVGSSELNGNDTHNWSALGVTLQPCQWGVKFRANGGWDTSWGASSITTAGSCIYSSATGSDNIQILDGGTYNIYFNDITGQFLFVEL